MTDEVLVRKCVMVATVTVVRRRLRDAALSRNGRLEEIDREYTALCVCVCVAVQACASIVRPTNSCIHVSRATLISFKGEARRNADWFNGKWRKAANLLKSISVISICLALNLQ